MRMWAIVTLACSGVLLVEMLVIGYLLHSSDTPFWRRSSSLIPARLAGLLLLLALRSWAAAGGRIILGRWRCVRACRHSCHCRDHAHTLLRSPLRHNGEGLIGQH